MARLPGRPRERAAGRRRKSITRLVAGGHGEPRDEHRDGLARRRGHLGRRLLCVRAPADAGGSAHGPRVGNGRVDQRPARVADHVVARLENWYHRGHRLHHLRRNFGRLRAPRRPRLPLRVRRRDDPGRAAAAAPARAGRSRRAGRRGRGDDVRGRCLPPLLHHPPVPKAWCTDMRAHGVFGRRRAGRPARHLGRAPEQGRLAGARGTDGVLGRRDGARPGAPAFAGEGRPGGGTGEIRP
mmetsp:Transcript_3873/g.9680  ORF Transcript_3873/g.9680 Transcript_3873/m.9680 type:complete len:240 (-) Transcript_3873:97-816(-)